MRPNQRLAASTCLIAVVGGLAYSQRSAAGVFQHLDSSVVGSVQTSGGGVTSWQDQSGAGRHAAPSAGSVTYPSAGAFPSGVSGVQINGFSSRSELALLSQADTNTLLNGAGGFSLFLAVDPESTSNNNWNDLLGTSTAVPNANGFGVRWLNGTSGGTPGTLQAYFGGDFVQNNLAGQQNYHLGAPFIVGVNYNPSLTGSEFTLSTSLNNYTDSMAAPGVSVASPRGLSLGGIGSASRFYNGSVGEVLINDSGLSPLGFQQQIDSLADKWLTSDPGEPIDHAQGAVGSSIAMHTGVKSLNLNDTDLQRMVDAGVKSVRLRMSWGAEIEKTVGSYTWGPHDALLAKLDQHGIAPHILITHTHGAYNTNGITMDEQAERDGFAAFAAAAVSRYDQQYEGVTWEVWNEQDTSNFWSASTPGNTTTNARERAQDYYGLMTTAVPAMRAQSPDVFIVSGGTVSTGWAVSQAWRDEFLTLGGLSLIDALGVHTYKGGNNDRPESYFLEEFEDMRQLLDGHGVPGDFPIFNTEWGVDISHFPSGTTAERRQKQATTLVRMSLLNQIVGIDRHYYYTWQDGAENGESIIDPSSDQPRPAYFAIDTYADQLGAYSFVERLSVGDPDDYVLLFQSGDDYKLAAWTTDPNHSRTIAVESHLSQLTVTDLLGGVSTTAYGNGALTLLLSGDVQYVDLGAVPQLIGDYNEDGVVDAADYSVWRDALGSPAGSLVNRDPAASGPIGQADYAAWRDNYGQSAGAAGGPAAAPEPAAFLLIAAGIGALGAGRRSRRGSLR